MARAKVSAEDRIIVIPKPQMTALTYGIVGTAPYVQHRFGVETLKGIKEDQEKGAAKGKKKGAAREPKDFNKCYEDCFYWGKEPGKKEKPWHGIPIAAIRSAMISACRISKSVAMTQAKLLVFIRPEGFDIHDGTPLMKLVGEVTRHEGKVNLRSGDKRTIDIRVRPLWLPGWRATVTIRFDSNFITTDSVGNLLELAGENVGVGEGRPDSPASNGCGWGTFRVEHEKGCVIHEEPRRKNAK